MDTPSESDSAKKAYKYVTVSDLQELLRRVGQQRIYRRSEDGEEEAAQYAERYLSAVRRYQEAKKKSAEDDGKEE